MVISAKQKALEALREECHASLWKFAQTVEPLRVYGDCHRELFEMWQKADLNDVLNTLALMPRDHQKSHCLAVRCAWEIYNNPAITIIYVSATAGLAERQLYDIKNILTSTEFTLLCPEMLEREEGKRAMWNTSAIAVDHPARKKEGVRDPTVATAGLTTNTTGWHCNFLAKDDVVVPDNAYTADGRKKVEAACSQLASVLTTDGRECAVGTRYHPQDHYNTLIEMMEDVHDEETGEIIDSVKTYQVHERQVETSGVFLWPRMRRSSDGKMFGFDWAQLAKKKAKYKDRLQFYAQYYNNPNDIENRAVERENFRYYKREDVQMKGGRWHYKARRLNVYAAVDFAFSKRTKADYSCVVVFGIDFEFNVYVLDILRFKTDKTQVYFKNIKAAWLKWGFTYIRAEITAAQAVIVSSIKDMIAEEGLHIRVEEHRPNRYDGAKEERIDAALTPRYEAGTILHYYGAECSLLEEEILLDNPPHDDISDTLASGLSANFVSKPPRPRMEESQDMSSLHFHKRFGGAY